MVRPVCYHTSWLDLFMIIIIINNNQLYFMRITWLGHRPISHMVLKNYFTRPCLWSYYIMVRPVCNQTSWSDLVVILLHYGQTCNHTTSPDLVRDHTTSWSDLFVIILHHHQTCLWSYYIMVRPVCDHITSWSDLFVIILHHGQTCLWSYYIMVRPVCDHTTSSPNLFEIILHHC